MTDLITRLEAATGADREIDALIFGEMNAERIIGLYPNGPGGPFATGEDGTIFDIPHYTGSLDAARSLAEDGVEFETTSIYGVASVTVGLNCNDLDCGAITVRRADGNMILAECTAWLELREIRRASLKARGIGGEK